MDVCGCILDCFGSGKLQWIVSSHTTTFHVQREHNYKTTTRKRTSNTNFIILEKSTNDTSNVFFVMHFGLPKTGTTTIQCGLRQSEDVLLQEGNLAILETESCRTEIHDYERHHPLINSSTMP